MVLTRTLSPGAYLRHRRQAAMLSIGDVAAMIHTTPRWSELERSGWLQRIEADVEQPTFRTVVALRQCFSFDIRVLANLVAIADGATIDHPRLCRICACSDFDACDGRHQLTPHHRPDACHWVERDLCSACAGGEPPHACDPVAANSDDDTAGIAA